MVALNITLEGKTELVQRLDRMPAALNAVLQVKVASLQHLLEVRIKSKLQNKVLRVRRGKLMASIHSPPLTVTDATVTARVVSSGDVKYAAIHEFGGVINHPGGTAYYPGRDGKAQFLSNATAAKMEALGRILPRTRPHQIRMPERSFMRSSLGEMAAQISEEIKRSAVEAPQRAVGQ